MIFDKGAKVIQYMGHSLFQKITLNKLNVHMIKENKIGGGRIEKEEEKGGGGGEGRQGRRK